MVSCTRKFTRRSYPVPRANWFVSYTPEVMPVAHRGTGCGVTLAVGRIASLSSPFIATFADLKTSAPIWVCLGLYVVIATVALFLPYEPKHMLAEDEQ
jgi:hypothetical protein